MASHTYTAHTTASAEAAFDYMADLRNTPEWLSMIDTVELRTGGDPIGVGTRFDVKAKRRWGGNLLDYEIVEFEQPHRIVWRVSGTGLSEAQDSYTVSPEGDGVIVTYETDFTSTGGPVADAAGGLLAKGLDHSVTKHLEAALNGLT